MKANELRINNLLWFVDEIVKVSSIKNNTSNPENGSIRVDNQILWIPLDRIEPIQLTEDWFYKLPNEQWEFVGFGTRLIVQHKKFLSIKIEFCNNQFAFYFNDNLIGFKDYVHEVQNLYFALTGQELEYKE